MFLKKVDLLSPQITLFYKGDESHSSIFSGIISLVAYTIVFIFGVYYALEFINKENPTAYFFNRYVEDTGNYPMNSSSMFHFIQMMETGDNYHKYTDFNAITIYGLEVTIDDYMKDNNPMLQDHWIYGYCNNDTDTKGVAHLINHELYEQALCIRKYYNKAKDTYYETTDPNFRWPSVDKGCSHPDRTFYGIVMEKCRNNTARKKAGYEDCKSLEEINDYIFSSSIIIQLIDYYPDVLNYEVPFTKYFYALTNGLFKDSVTVNHLNFHPALMKTHNGIFFDNQVDEQVYIFIQNEKVTLDDKVEKEINGVKTRVETGIVVSWYFWMLNTMEYYERNYKRLQDILGDIGGVSSIVILAAEVINFLASRYILLLDTEELMQRLSTENRSKLNRVPTIFRKNDKILFPPRRNYYYRNNNNPQNNNQRIINYQRVMKPNVVDINNASLKNDSDQNKNLFNKNSNRNNMINIYMEDESEFNSNSKSNQRRMLNRGYNEKNGRTYSTGRMLGTNNEMKNNENENYMSEYNDQKKEVETNKKSNFSFFKYLGYLFTCGKSSPDISYFVNLREQIISEENMVQSYFDVYNLLKINKIDRPKQNELI